MQRLIAILISCIVFATEVCLPDEAHTQNGARDDTHILLIGIDGCSVDILQKVDTPNIDRLADRGLFFEHTDIVRAYRCHQLAGPVGQRY